MRSCYGRVFNEGFRNIIVDTDQVVVDICWLIQYVLSYCCVLQILLLLSAIVVIIVVVVFITL